MTYLDTHVVVWLYEGNNAKLSRPAAERIQADTILISPVVIMELQLLHEIRRLRRDASSIVGALSGEIGLGVCQLPFHTIVGSALEHKWVRDPFDRLIVAHASANDAGLITKDENIRRHYKHAVW